MIKNAQREKSAREADLNKGMTEYTHEKDRKFKR